VDNDQDENNSNIYEGHDNAIDENNINDFWCSWKSLVKNLQESIALSPLR
jgi:hypothetical protein